MMMLMLNIGTAQGTRAIKPREKQVAALLQGFKTLNVGLIDVHEPGEARQRQFYLARQGRRPICFVDHAPTFARNFVDPSLALGEIALDGGKRGLDPLALIIKLLTRNADRIDLCV